jgi:hypothetical protein
LIKFTTLLTDNSLILENRRTLSFSKTKCKEKCIYQLKLEIKKSARLKQETMQHKTQKKKVDLEGMKYWCN